jgi:hypothetical protein
MTRVGAVYLNAEAQRRRDKRRKGDKSSVGEIPETLVSFSDCRDARCVSLASLCLCGEEIPSVFLFTAEARRYSKDFALTPAPSRLCGKSKCLTLT